MRHVRDFTSGSQRDLEEQFARDKRMTALAGGVTTDYHGTLTHHAPLIDTKKEPSGRDSPVYDVIKSQTEPYKKSN